MARSLAAAALCLALAAPAVWAQQDPGTEPEIIPEIVPEPEPEADEPGSLRRLLDDMLDSVNPWLSELGEMLGDLSGWHAPEFLPNGDILIRRRHEDQSPLPEEAEPGEPFEL